MTISVEYRTSLSPDIPRGTQSVVVDGFGILFVIWKDGLKIRVQRHDRSGHILTHWFTSFSLPPTTLDKIIVCPFISGGCIIISVDHSIHGTFIRYYILNSLGTLVPTSNNYFSVDLDLEFPQIACTTDARDYLAITHLTSSGSLLANVIAGLTTNAQASFPQFRVNSAPIAPQKSEKEYSLLSVTSNWTVGEFAALYMRRSDGNGLIRKFNEFGIDSQEIDVLETFRSCPTGGADRGLPALVMDENSEQLFLVNPILEFGLTNPPTRIRARLYKEDLGDTIYATIINNPLSTNFKLNCIGAGYFGNAAFVIDDEGTNINVIGLNAKGRVTDILPDIDLGEPYITKSTASIFGNKIVIGYHNLNDGPNGTSFILALKLEKTHIRGYGSRPIDIARLSGPDDTSVSIITGLQTNIVNTSLRPRSSLTDFIGSKDLMLVGGPADNIASAELFSDTERLREEFKKELMRIGISELKFLDIDKPGDGLDDRDGTTANAPKFEFTTAFGQFRAARHQSGILIYDYGILLRVGHDKTCYIMAGIRDISTVAAAKYLTHNKSQIDNVLEIFDAALVVTGYPFTTNSVSSFENEIVLGTAFIRFIPLVGIRTNSPEIL